MAKAPVNMGAGGVGRAAVTPRVRVWPDGEILPLEYHIERLLERSARGEVSLFGPPGSGKSTALRQLAAVFGDRIVMADDAPGGDPRQWTGLAVLANTERRESAVLALEMAAWGEDDLIEYMLHVDREHCASVMGRLRAVEERERLQGSPALWVVVLEEFAKDEHLATIDEALLRRIKGGLTQVRYDEAAGSCLKMMALGCKTISTVKEEEKHLEHLLRHRIVAMMIAAETFSRELAEGHAEYLLKRLPRELVEETGRRVAERTDVGLAIENAIRARAEYQSMGVSVLLLANRGWRPAGWKMARLSGAYAADAQWRGLDLSGCEMRDVNLAGADLAESVLDGAVAQRGNLQRAMLSGAHMSRTLLTEANLSAADLSHAEAEAVDLELANLEGANLAGILLDGAMLDRAQLAGAHCAGARLRGASLRDTKLDHADFSGADMREAILEGVRMRDACFSGASFRKARVVRCDLEFLELPGADFEGASLLGSHLTGTVMREANLRYADLRQTGLAEVDWVGADLRDADFRGASFHMGSSRSGLVKSDIASEGTRTGFYTDDYYDQDFKAPEEIRKANLCGCNLRGANVELTDFYLVDLREANYTENQRRHFQRCGAILRARK